jgi:K+-transporting ATPase KdpF subunit
MTRKTGVHQFRLASFTKNNIIYNQMKNKVATSLTLLVAVPAPAGEIHANGTLSYLIGGIIALLIMGYLVYTLMHPDKF